MALKYPAKEEYTVAIKKLFPQGSYWENLLKDSSSDLNKVIMAKADQLVAYRTRAEELKKEAFLSSCNETISDYERVYLGDTNNTLPLEQRKLFLVTKQKGAINISAIKELAKIYGVVIIRVYFPYREAFFAHSFFGSFMSSPAGKNVLFIKAQAPEGIRSDFEKVVTSSLLANHIIYFFYGG